MKHGHLPAIISLLFISFISCEYDPHGIFERDLNQNVEPANIETVSLDLFADQDTILLLYNRVCFHFKSSNQAIRLVVFILDDSLMGSVESDNGYFDIQYDSLYEGYHRLKIEILTRAGTGSIADSLGIEGILFATKEWTIKVHYTPYSVLTSTVSDGFLKLQWPKPYETASYYIVYRYNIELGRTNECEYIDKGYVGEGGDYYVRYYNKSGQLVSYGWVQMPKEMELKFTSDENNNYAVEWEKPKYYAAVDTILVYGYDDYERTTIQKTADINQTSFEISKTYFGKLRSYSIGFIPKYSNPVYSIWKTPYPRFFSSEIQCEIGYPSPIFGRFCRINGSEFMYHTYMYDHGSTSDSDSLFRYSTGDNAVVESFRYDPQKPVGSNILFIDPTTSPDGSHYISEVEFNKTAIYGQTDDFRKYKILDISELTSSVTKIAISNVGTGIVYSYDRKYLYDFENDTLLGYAEMAGSLSNYNISPDGRYLFFSSYSSIWLYKYQDDTLTLEKEIWTESYPGFDYFNFMDDEPGKAVSWDKDTKEFSILTCPELTVLTHFTVWEDQILDIDYSNDRILSCTSGKLVVRSLLDGSVEYEIPLSRRFSIMTGYYLQGNSIFYKDGARYFLN